MTTTDAPVFAGRTAAHLPRTRGARWGAWLLAVSPAYFVLFIATSLGVLAANAIPPFNEITREQMDAIRLGWIVISILFPLAFILGTIGVVLLAAALARLGGAPRVWAWVAVVVGAVSIALFLPYAAFRIAAMGFTEQRLGDNEWYSFWEPAGYVGNHAALAALALLCVALFVGARIRTASLIIGALAVAFLIAGIAQLLLPPFIISFLWCALGVVWLRSIRRRPAES